MPRVETSEILDNFERSRVYNFVRGNPGLRLNIIRDTLSLHNGSVGYHLYMLEKHGFVYSSRGKESKKSRQIYPIGYRLPVVETLVNEPDFSKASRTRATAKA